MLVIDGSHGEGGGQIVRTAVALSVIFNQGVKINNIRSGRGKPGLKQQHLHAIKALQELTNADVNGLLLGSTELEFMPQGISGREVTVKIPTAGSIGLVLQCLITALLKTPHEVRINFIGGATCGEGSPSLDYMINVWFPNMARWGVSKPEVIIEREGYYPKGGAQVTVIVKPSRIKPHSILDKGKILKFAGLSHASKSLESRRVAERQALEAEKLLDCKVDYTYSDSLSSGSSLTLWAECDNSVIGSDSLGKRGVTSEDVARDAVKKLREERGAIDSHCADMLVPLIAIAGQGEITTSKVTNHALTNAWLCEQFIRKRFKIKENKISL